LDGKANLGHTHVIGDVTGLTAALAAKADGSGHHSRAGRKANAFTTVNSFNVDQAVSDAAHNGATTR
jgi:hypothetical protein